MYMFQCEGVHRVCKREINKVIEREREDSVSRLMGPIL